MKYLLTIIITLLSITSYSQRNIYTPLYPLDVKFISKTGADSNWNFFMSQANLDSLKFIYDTAKNHNTRLSLLSNQLATTNSNLTTTNNSLSATGATVASHGLQLTALSNQTATNQTDITVLKGQVAAIGTPPAPRTITTTTYQVIQSDNGSTLLFPAKCVITIGSNIQMPFRCKIIQQGQTNSTGQVQFSGVNINSMDGWKRVKKQYGKVEIEETSNGIFNLNGDLKL